MAATASDGIRRATTVLLAVFLWLHALFFLNFQSPLLSSVGRLLHLTTSEAILAGLLVIFSFLTVSGFWRTLRSLAYIYFFPFVLLSYFLYLCVLVIRHVNRWMAARGPAERGDLTLVDQKTQAVAPVQSALPAPEPLRGKGHVEVMRVLSRPFRCFTVLWGVLLLVTTHLVVVWLCLIVLLVQLARKIFFIGKVLLFSEPWLKKYGPLLFAGLNKTLEALDALTPDADPNDKEFKSLLGQLNLWRQILEFLKNPYLLSRWAWVLAVVLFAFIYTYFAILFSFGYYGIARVCGVNYSWAEALTTSMFLPLYATDLPKPFAIRLLGGLQGSLILAVGIGTVMNFLRRKLDAVRRAAIAFSDRLDEQVAGGKHPILESMRSAPPTGGGVHAENKKAAAGPGDDEDDRFSEELHKLRQQVAAARSSEAPNVKPIERRSGANSAMEPGNPASALFELGENHEMRIEWPSALDAYRSAWEIEKKPKYGIKYAAVAQALNRVQEAASTYEEILTLRVHPTERADVLMFSCVS